MVNFLNIMESPARRIDSMESGFDSDDVPVQPPARFTPKRLLAVGAGLLGVAGCAAAAFHGSAAAPVDSAAEQEHVTARSLLEHPDFIDAAANNVWAVAGHQLQGKEHKLRPAMHSVMKKVTAILEEHDPEGGRQLASVKLTHTQKDDVLSMVKRMSDQRVQKVGKEILDIAAKHQNDKERALEAVQKDISSTFNPRMTELKTLKNSVVPASLRDAQDKSESQAAMPAQQRRLPETKCDGDTSKCNPGSELTSEMGKGMNMKLEDAMGIVGGLLEQARLALDESTVIGSSFGSPQHVPWMWRSLIGGAAFGVETADCFMRQDDQHKLVDGKETLVNANSGVVNSVKMSMCPMKYAGAGMDFLSGLNNVMGIQNTRLPQDFQLMFGGHPTAGYGASPFAAAAPAAPNPFAMFLPPTTPSPLAHAANAMNAMHGMMNAATASQNMMNAASAAHGMMQNAAAMHPMTQHAFAYR